MIENPDKLIIDQYLEFCAKRDLTLIQVGALVGRSKQWASSIANGVTKTLKFSTRNRIKKVLGI